MPRKASNEVEAIMKPYNAEMKRHIVGLVKKSNADIKRYTGALSEEFQGHVKVIAEQHLDIKKDIKDIKSTLGSHTEMIGKLAVDMEIVKTNVETIKGDLKRKVDYDEFLKLERRVSAIEAKSH
jgi:hypothetical protein